MGVVKAGAVGVGEGDDRSGAVGVGEGDDRSGAVRVEVDCK